MARDGAGAPVSYLGTEGILNGLNVGDPFFNKLGATIAERTCCDSGACTAYTMTIGATAGVDPESLAHSRYILIWACNMISTNLHLWPFVAEAQRRGAKVVVIDPVRHRTAAHADWYIPIRPGTDGALALALMNVFSWGHLYVTLNTPAIEPVGEAISNTELFRRLAARMGFTEECFTRTDEQYVRVYNDRGQFIALAQVRDDIAAGVVMAPMGAWRKNAKGHSTVNAVNPFVFADLGNAPTFSDTRVEIEPAKGSDS